MSDTPTSGFTEDTALLLFDYLTAEQIQLLANSHRDMLILLRWLQPRLDLGSHMTQYIARLVQRAEAARR